MAPVSLSHGSMYGGAPMEKVLRNTPFLVRVTTCVQYHEMGTGLNVALDAVTRPRPFYRAAPSAASRSRR